MYKKDTLREYIKKSELRTYSKRINIRLSKELSIKYDKGIYNDYLSNLQKYLEMIDNLNIKYPANAKPILYIYIVPDDNYSELLKAPKIYDKGNGMGKPVKCYDIDGYNYAYGISQNKLENAKKEENISKIENTLHELSHMVHSQFFLNQQLICEGFSETLPLYVIELEKVYEEHKNMIINIDESEILTAEELINSERNYSFGTKSIMPNKTCSFRYSYISSYLFVRGCIQTIKENNNCTKIEATQTFLEIIKGSSCLEEWLVFDIANAINVPQDELLCEKKIQLKALLSIKNNE